MGDGKPQAVWSPLPGSRGTQTCLPPYILHFTAKAPLALTATTGHPRSAATNTSRSCGRPCGPGSAGTPRCRGCSRQRGHCSGRAGSWGNPRSRAGSGRTVARTRQGSSGTGLSPRRRRRCTNLGRGTRKLQGEEERGCVSVPSPIGSPAQRTGSHVRLQPLGPNPKVPGAHLSHCLPTTLGRHWHCPPLGSHTELSEPWGSHWQARKREALGSSENCVAGHSPRGSTHMHVLPMQTWKHHQASRYGFLHKRVATYIRRSRVIVQKC